MPILFLTVFIDLIGFGIVIPILPFLAPKLGATNFDIALIIVIYSVFAGLVGTLWGKLSDKIGRKPVIIFCLIVTAFSYFLLANAETLTMVYVARILAGSVAGIYGVASAMVADLSTPENRAKSMGLVGAAFGLGMVFGPFLGGVLAGDELNFFLPCMVAMGLSIFASIFGFIFMKESHTKDKQKAHKEWRQTSGKTSSYKVLKESGNRWLISQFFLHSMVITIVSYLFPLWMGAILDWGPRQIGIVFGIQGLMMAALQAKLIGVFAKRFGEMQVLAFGIGLLTLGFTFATFSTTQPFMIASFFITITGASMCMPLMNSLISQRTDMKHRGRIMGASSAMGAWGRVAGPLIAGAILSVSDYHYAWAFGILIGLAYLTWPLIELTKQKTKLAATNEQQYD
ncbi:MFS transporter [Thalassotalea psychrophila]|uniref:MFS transporter n=1 Tax=Thalassotalea psychrophila TaxID=3065647 RepID=A0ABY9TUF1_9GAMM|nr:MFS transporter [Colwelliaceae bacterium SQ149]